MSKKTIKNRIGNLENQKDNQSLLVAIHDTTLDDGYSLSDGRHLTDLEFEAFQRSLGSEIKLQIIEILDNSKVKNQ